MTAKEAIKKIKDKICTEGKNGGIYHFCDDSCMYGKSKCPIGMAIEALEKQIPKKPIDIEIPSGNFELQCPTCCNKFFYKNSIFNKGMNYCDQCGQALDWSENQKK